MLTTAAAIVALTTSGGHALLLDIYLLCLGGVVLLALVRATRAQAATVRASQFDRALALMRRQRAESGEPALVRDLELSTVNAFHLHARVRPIMREIAAHRLRARHGIELDDAPARAQERVGDHAWEVVRPDRPPPEDRLGPGPSFAEIARMVDELERI